MLLIDIKVIPDEDAKKLRKKFKAEDGTELKLNEPLITKSTIETIGHMSFYEFNAIKAGLEDIFYGLKQPGGRFLLSQ